MPTELPKTYDPAAVEAAAYQTWLDERAFHADPAAPGPAYTIVIPPPNVTGALHLGHAIDNTLQDILIRQHRMAGFNTLWVPGIDHAGIATQAVVEKQLKEKENKTRHDVGREGLIERIWAWKQQYGDRIINQLQRMGCSCDWQRTRFTLDEVCAAAVRETFFRLFRDGLVFRGKRLVNWDVFLQTSVSDDEIYHETVKTSLWHIRYEIVEDRADPVTPSPGIPGEGRGEGSERSGAPVDRPHDGANPHANPLPEYRAREQDAAASTAPTANAVAAVAPHPRFMIVATTRPETLLGDTAVAVHSQDRRWNWAIGRRVRLPLTGRLIPIMADDILVDPKFGSGVVKVTPAHDPNDYAVWDRHRNQADAIAILNILTPEGKINDNGGAYAGLPRDKARARVVADLTAQGLLEKEEPHQAPVGHSDRSKTPVEPYLSDQWFVKMAPLAEAALEVVRDGTIKFYPERHAQQYLAWLGEKRDWPISRQLWWGHRIPVWSRSSDGTATSMEKWRRLAEGGNLALSISGTGGSETLHICVRKPDAAIEAALAADGFAQDPDVLDTWFSSALWPHSTLGWPAETPELKRYYPTSVLVTGRDIITLWVARMVMTGLYNVGNEKYLANSPEAARAKLAADPQGVTKAIPFHDVCIHPTILDGKGERMSKTKGNGVDPVDVIESHGADALRFTLTNMATETQDARLPVLLVCPHCGEKFSNPESQAATGNCPKCKKPYTRALGAVIATADAPLAKPISDKFDFGRNFCNKLWNAARFVLSNIESVAAEPVDEMKWSLADRWIVSRFNRTLAEANEAMKTYRFDVYAKACYDFFWRDFCDWYVEATKAAMRCPAPIKSTGNVWLDRDGPTRAGQTANVLAATLDAALRLMHPVIPFITETIWWKLNEVRPNRELPGRIAGAGNAPRLIKAAWPTVGDFSEAAEHIFPKLQEMIQVIRNVRNEYKVDPRKSVTVSISAPPEPMRQIIENREMIELLAVCSLDKVAADLPPPPEAARASAAGCEIFIEGLIDPAAEKQRQQREIADLQKTIAAMESRLSNAGYLAKAPPQLVQQTQEQLAAAKAKLAKLKTTQ